MREELDYDLYGRPTAHRASLDGVPYGEATFTWEDGHLLSTTDSIRNEARTLAYEPGTGRLQSETFSTKGETRFLTYDVRSRIARETFIVPPSLGMGDPIVLVIGYDHDLADRLVKVFVDDGSPEGDLLREWIIEDGRVVEVRDGNGNLRETLFEPQTNHVVGYRMTDAMAVVVEDTAIERSSEVGPTRFQVRTETTTALASTEEEYWLNRPGGLLDVNGKVGMRVFRARGWDDGVLAHDRTYRWDALSNALDNSAGDSFVYNEDRTRLLEASGGTCAHSYQYDEAGYVTNRGGLEIAWTATGRVARVGPAVLPLAEATWDLSGGIVSVTADGETREFTYFGGRVERDATNGGPGWLHIGDVALPFVGDERRYGHTDFRGNVGIVSDETGVIVSHRRYHAFGLDRVHGTSGSGGSAMTEQVVLSGFAGGVAAHDLGLSFNGARVLDTDTGRFLSPDPLLHPLNQVTYAVGNPILFEDRGGLHESVASRAVNAFVAASGLVVSGKALVVAVAAFNAAPAAALPFAPVVVATVGTVGAYVAFGWAAFKLAQAIQAHIDSQPTANPFEGQQKQIDVEGDLGALQAILGLGLAAVAITQPELESPLEIPQVSPPGFGISLCAPIGSFTRATDSNTPWLSLGVLCALLSAWVAMRTRAST
jgi:RHS repeat-associated protein